MTIAEASEHLAGVPDGSLGGVVLSGVVDRLALHALLGVLFECRRTLAGGRPSSWSPSPSGRPAPGTWPRGPGGRSSAAEATWELLLERSGFVEVAPLANGVGADGRFAVAAVTPS